MKDKFNRILFVVCFISGMLIIRYIPNGKDGYWIIPLIFYWIIRYLRRKSKDNTDKQN
ncbi:hypothetical protein [Cytobacillus firmus]|uniref:hypothetical protein n=1 Tax=Cytobacillus firmus TaxID=1399 RepID=UPI0024944648|nr:hypothetical protein [Cytobacillus firmus]